MPGHDERMAMWDQLPAAEAVARAWRDPGNPSKFGTWHRQARVDVEYCMPLLARALDRLLAELEHKMPSTDWRLWEWPEGLDPADTVRTDRLRSRLRGRRQERITP
jgi:hypothetical protein